MKKVDRNFIHFTRIRGVLELTGFSKEMAKELTFRFLSASKSSISGNQKTCLDLLHMKLAELSPDLLPISTLSFSEPPDTNSEGAPRNPSTSLICKHLPT